jgi:hypothetical protein
LLRLRALHLGRGRQERGRRGESERSWVCGHAVVAAGYYSYTLLGARIVSGSARVRSRRFSSGTWARGCQGYTRLGKTSRRTGKEWARARARAQEPSILGLASRVEVQVNWF